ncbi:MAG: 2,5-diamino-6-(ribosylamino)-4(3H)-pyrimidinone 5'-phosphate reductase [Candidatus Bathyarchaeota archaeon]|nr:2,5-diamino-6-(ribosylamino)-4(3H)-pyrimidinone 5'-phosphate reductase [Candidatus Termiticorpusculum sp.]
MSVDGKIAPVNRKGREFSQYMQPIHEQMLHEIRAGVDAIIIGVNTVIADNPTLTVRKAEGKNPLRVIIDSQARTPLNSKILNQKTDNASTLIALAKDAPKNKVAALKNKNVDLIYASSSLASKRVDLAELLFALSKRGVKRVLVEGGGEVRWSFFEQNLVDELFVWVMPTIWGGRDAPTLVEGSGFLKAENAVNLEFKSINQVENMLILWFNINKKTRSPPTTPTTANSAQHF